MMEVYPNCSKLKNCYILSNKCIKHNIKALIKERKNKEFKITRTERSYISETISHRRLYKLGLFKERTRDADLEENIKPLLNIAYLVVGFYI